MNLDIIRGLYYMIRLGMDPNNTEMVFRLGSSVRNPSTKRAIVAELKQDPEVAAVLEAKPSIPRMSLDLLRACPEASLGAAALEFYTTNNLDPGIFPDYDETDEFDYFRTRMGHTHDIRHVLTGFGTDVIGEVAVQAFDLAQIRQSLPALIMAVALAKSAIVAPESIPDVVRAITEGYAMGKRAKNLFVVDLAKYYRKPLADVRRELGMSA
jgi:ubiquinone biosynthesis protein COQ4